MACCGWCRVMYNTLLDMYGKVGHIDAALAIHEEMRVAGWKTDVVRQSTSMLLHLLWLNGTPLTPTCADI